ncbi:cell division protein FtsN [Bacillus cereus ATCC 10876]|uniref:CalY family protein n=1 Tax=Bacillus TaxID=1386 RepID=UPI00019FF782|nr:MULTISPECIES: CalY family protein [Bacillus]MDJ0281498.1 CalY family protein [Bacillus bombysepticus]EEK51852.1 Camelysin; Metallo peptidase; MEROPS family M73 [Bacillus cereus ATCC 10876]KFL73597.1 SipW-cognate class signal peptide domain protein [Bacillus cereus ATCC 10876]MBG9864686.1 cell division protein FtsN [Bacillus cereus]MBO1131866.1 M73 family metallopeptidase [Bacillus cereus]
MTLKKKLGMGITSAVLGAALVGGGTFAFFSDKEVSNNTFAAGTLDLALNPSTVVNVSNLKPGDTIEKEFKLENKGSLNIKKVLLKTDYNVEDVKKDNKDDFGKHIKVTFLKNVDKHETIVKQTTLDKLKGDTLTAVDNDLSAWFWDEKGISAGKSDKFKVKFGFVDNGKDQNQFQGDKLQLNWTFDAQQTAGEER